MQKLSEIEDKLNEDYTTIKNRNVILKRCKYALLILKMILLSLGIGLYYLSILMIETEFIVLALKKRA